MLIKSGYNFENNKCYDFTQHISSVFFFFQSCLLLCSLLSRIYHLMKKNSIGNFYVIVYIIHKSIRLKYKFDCVYIYYLILQLETLV